MIDKDNQWKKENGLIGGMSVGRLMMFSLQPYRAPLIRELEDWVGPTLVVRGTGRRQQVA